MSISLRLIPSGAKPTDSVLLRAARSRALPSGGGGLWSHAFPRGMYDSAWLPIQRRVWQQRLKPEEILRACGIAEAMPW